MKKKITKPCRKNMPIVYHLHGFNVYISSTLIFLVVFFFVTVKTYIDTKSGNLPILLN